MHVEQTRPRHFRKGIRLAGSFLKNSIAFPPFFLRLFREKQLKKKRKKIEFMDEFFFSSCEGNVIEIFHGCLFLSYKISVGG